MTKVKTKDKGKVWSRSKTKLNLGSSILANRDAPIIGP